MIFLLPDSQSQLTAAPSTVLSRPGGPASRAYGGCATSFSCSHAAVALSPQRNGLDSENSAVGFASRRSHRAQSRLHRGEHLHMRGDAASEVQHQAAGVFDELRRTVHHLLQHCLDASALGRVTDRRELAGQPELADQAQAVV
jgi:hypothetical protein